MIVARRQALSASRAPVLRAWCYAALTVSLAACAAPERDAASANGPEIRRTRATSSAQQWGAAVHTELARVYFEGGAIDVAGDEALRALDVDAQDRDAAHLLALVALERGDPALAAHYFDRALSSRGAREDRVLAGNYARFVCERAAKCASARPLASDRRSLRGNERGNVRQTGEIGQLRAQSIAIDNSAAFDPNQVPLNNGRVRQSHNVTGGTINRRTRQEYSSEELRDE